jgi:exosome complex RNA-binding protein Rrp42 (RNase PH superfamily)
MMTKPVLTDQVAAISCGIVGGEPVLDLNYDEDSTAETDMNLVMTGSGGIIEIQGTAEKKPFTNDEMNALIGTCAQGHQQARRLAEDDGRLIDHGAQTFRQSRDRDPQFREAERDARTCWRRMASR